MSFSPLEQFTITKTIPLVFLFSNPLKFFRYFISDSNLTSTKVSKKTKAKKEKSNSIKFDKWMKIRGKTWNFKVSNQLFLEIQKPGNCLDYQKKSDDFIILEYLSFLTITPIISEKRPFFVKFRNGVKLQVMRDFYDYRVGNARKQNRWR